MGEISENVDELVASGGHIAWAFSIGWRERGKEGAEERREMFGIAAGYYERGRPLERRLDEALRKLDQACLAAGGASGPSSARLMSTRFDASNTPLGAEGSAHDLFSFSLAEPMSEQEAKKFVEGLIRRAKEALAALGCEEPLMLSKEGCSALWPGSGGVGKIAGAVRAERATRQIGQAAGPGNLADRLRSARAERGAEEPSTPRGRL